MEELIAQVVKCCSELDRRTRLVTKLDGYVDGDCPFPQAVVKARLTKAYRTLMPMAEAPWGSLIVNSSKDRLEVSGIRTSKKDDDRRLWSEVWQANSMDAESKLGHDAALTHGRAYATVWRSGSPEVTLDNATQMVVLYAEGSRRERVCALRRWVDGRYPMATLYRPDGIYKFQGPKHTSGGPGTQWEKRTVEGEDWPLANPLDAVPVVELSVNQKLKPGEWGSARGEFEHCVGLIDRINLLTFLGLVVALWMGFPLRGILGAEILKDDDGNDLPPFDAEADKVFQIEDEKAQIAEFKAADRKNLSVFAELDQLAVITSTPRHYFPLEQGMSNLSADAIRASEGGHAAKTTGHKASLGEDWEEVIRLGGKLLEPPINVPRTAEVNWKDHESRSMAERADAAVKMKDILPWQVIAERFLNATDEEINRWAAMRGGDVLGTLMEGLTGEIEPAPA